MLQIAKILKSNGTDGGLLIGVRDIEVGQIDLQEPVFIEFDGLPVPFFIQDLQQRGTSKAIVHLNDITSLADAEEVVGRGLFIEGEWEEEEELDFTGWTLMNRGERVGTVTGMDGKQVRSFLGDVREVANAITRDMGRFFEKVKGIPDKADAR